MGGFVVALDTKGRSVRPFIAGTTGADRQQAKRGWILEPMRQETPLVKF